MDGAFDTRESTARCYQEILDSKDAEMRARDERIAELEAQLDYRWADQDEDDDQDYDREQDDDAQGQYDLGENGWTQGSTRPEDLDRQWCPHPEDAEDRGTPTSNSPKPSNDDNQGESSVSAHQCTECFRYKQIYADSSDDSLAKRTRLDDTAFYDGCLVCGEPSSRCRVPFRFQIGLLAKAHELAQQTLWNALRRHYPEMQRKHYPESYAEISFGRAEVDHVFNPDRAARNGNNQRLGCQGLNGVKSEIDDIVLLRNALAHQHRLANHVTDGHIRNAQRLAVAVGDEPRAMKLRRLRDDFQRALEKALEQIETREPYAAANNARGWPMHHQLVFKDAMSDYGFDGFEKWPLCIQRAALEWNKRGEHPFECGADFDVVVRAANARVKSIDDIPKYKEVIDAYNAALRHRETERRCREDAVDSICLAEFFAMTQGEGDEMDKPEYVLVQTSSGPDASLMDEIGLLAYEEPLPPASPEVPWTPVIDTDWPSAWETSVDTADDAEPTQSDGW